jgi:hypothetical protein
VPPRPRYLKTESIKRDSTEKIFYFLRQRTQDFASARATRATYLLAEERRMDFYFFCDNEPNEFIGRMPAAFAACTLPVAACYERECQSERAKTKKTVPTISMGLGSATIGTWKRRTLGRSSLPG